jgi:uncharacterized membrane protein YdjX (TVP38/TMEM64 family)
VYRSKIAVHGVRHHRDRAESSIAMPPTDDRQTPSGVAGRLRPALRRFAPVAVILVLIGLAYGLGLHRDLSFETLIRNRAAIDRFVAQHGLAAVGGYIALYIAVISLSLPGGAILTTAGGFLFGPVVGSMAACVGALAGATVIFLIARSAVGEVLTRRAGPFAARLAEGFRADAFNYLLFLRLVPFPFGLVNLAPALFGVRLRTFVAATAIGIVPATVTFAVFGAGLDSAIAATEAGYEACLAVGRSDCRVDFDLSNVMTPTLLGALAAFGVLALVPVFARRIWGRRFNVDVPSKKP